MTWKVILSRQAIKDAKKLAQVGYQSPAENLLKLLEINPYTTPLRYEKLIGNLAGLYSRRITIQHRLVYRVLEKEKTVFAACKKQP